MFELIKTDGGARLGTLHTAHGKVETPLFMPVATKGTVKTLRPDELSSIGVQAIISNALHLYISPGVEMVSEHGGIHGLMGWDGTIFTDSGGFQMVRDFQIKVTDESIKFKSYRDGSIHEMTPEKCIAVQEELGSDVLMCLDWCPPYPAKPSEVAQSVKVTTEWAARCKASFKNKNDKSLLFGIVQGGNDPAQRKESAQSLVKLGFDGYGIGGLSIGEPKELMANTISHTTKLLPIEKPRYLMGVGSVPELIRSIATGVDIFDSAFPTRGARHRTILTRKGRYEITKTCYAKDMSPLEEKCTCPVCSKHTRAYIHHLFREKEMLGYRLASLHNLHVVLDVVNGAREAIRRDKFTDYAASFACENVSEAGI